MKMKLLTILVPVASLTLCGGISSSAFAKNASTNDSRSNGRDQKMNEMPMEAKVLASRFQVRGEVFELDKSGKKLLKDRRQYRIWQSADYKEGTPVIESQWSMDGGAGGVVAIKHSWYIDSNSEIKVTLEQFKTVVDQATDSGVEFRDRFATETKVIENFTPIVFVAGVSPSGVRTVIRLSPEIRELKEPEKLANFPISGKELTVTDNAGNVWTRDAEISGKYVAFVTHKGALALSYNEFSGSAELGQAEGNSLRVTLSDGRKVQIQSSTSFLPEGVTAKVFGRYLPDFKTARLTSTRMMSSSDEARFLERFK